MTVDRGLLALLEAKPGKGEELAAFLQQGRELAAAEEGTVTWYAFKLSETTYGIFDTFEDEDGRQAHLNGEIRPRSVRSPTTCWRASPTSARRTSSP
jgi:quinol monooxygenase YgiN